MTRMTRMTQCSTLAVSNVDRNIVSTPVLTLILLLFMFFLIPQVQAKPASPPQYVQVNEENSQDTLLSRDSGNIGASEYSVNTRAARSEWSADSLHIIEESARNPRGARAVRSAETLDITNVSTRNPRGARQ